MHLWAEMTITLPPLLLSAIHSTDLVMYVRSLSIDALQYKNQALYKYYMQVACCNFSGNPVRRKSSLGNT